MQENCGFKSGSKSEQRFVKIVANRTNVWYIERREHLQEVLR